MILDKEQKIYFVIYVCFAVRQDLNAGVKEARILIDREIIWEGIIDKVGFAILFCHCVLLWLIRVLFIISRHFFED